MNRLQKWVRDMVGLANDGKLNFGITAHPFEWWDPVREEDVWAPYVQGKNMSPKICGYMNLVAYYAVVRREGKPPSRVLYTDADGFVGKDQYNAFPELKSGKHGLVNPTLADLEQAIKKAKKPQPSRRRRTRTTRGGN